MASFFKDSTMWCESKNPHVQRACKIFASEEVKQVVCMIVLTVVIVKILEWLRNPVRRSFNWMKKKITNWKRGKRPIPSVPRPCILKVDYDAKLDIDKSSQNVRGTTRRKQKSRNVDDVGGRDRAYEPGKPLPSRQSNEPRRTLRTSPESNQVHV